MTTIATRVFRLPDLGEGLTEAGLVQWLVSVGDTITTDQAIAEVETAKSIVELPSPFAGVVLALHGEPGETINVGAPVLEVGDPDATAKPAATAAAAAAADATEHEVYRAEERAGSGNVLIGYGTTERAGRGRRRARVAARSRAGAGGTVSAGAVSAGAGGPVASSPTAPSASTSPATPPSHATFAPQPSPDATASEKPRTVAVRSPLVRRLARDLGLDVHTITATGADGAITRADVLRAAVDHAVDGVTAPAGAARVASGHSATTTTGAVIDGLSVQSRKKFSPMRKAVSATLSRSRAEIPEATVWVDVDATRLWNLRPDMAVPGEKAPSITALIARFTLLALTEYPLLASRLNDAADEIITFDGVNLGIAADTPRGLMVPVIAQAHTLTVAQLDAQLRELAETARSGQMPPERLRGSTFTLNNYGGFGVDGSAAIINYPNVAILGVGRVLERPWVVDGEIVVRRIAQLSLVFDHRVCDGGYAAGFLRRVVDLIEQPMRAFGQV